MKINNKGITLVELIVSFAIVGVAMLYFFQTLTTVSNLYETSKKETSEFIEEDYYLRILDAYLEGKIINKGNTIGYIAGTVPVIGGKNFKKSWNGNIMVFQITVGTNEYRLYKYVPPALIVENGGI